MLVLENGRLAKKEKKLVKYFDLWSKMLCRCYGEVNSEYNSYEKVTVCDEWHNFQNFCDWLEDNYIEGYAIDKDLLQIGIDEKIYSPKFCRFVPSEINSLTVNIRANNKSGHHGVDKLENGRYRVRIGTFGSRKVIGTFKTFEEACSKYIEARVEYLFNIHEKYSKILTDEILRAIINRIQYEYDLTQEIIENHKGE